MKNKHLNYEELLKFRENEMSIEERKEALLHLQECDECRRKLINIERFEILMEESVSFNVPSGLKEKIIEKINSNVLIEEEEKIAFLAKLFLWSVLISAVFLWYIVFFYTGIGKIFISETAYTIIVNSITKALWVFSLTVRFLGRIISYLSSDYYYVGFHLVALLLFISFKLLRRKPGKENER